MYSTKINTKTTTQKVNTFHTDYIDWNYDWLNKKHRASMCCDEPEALLRIQKQKDYVCVIEDSFKAGVFASNYGGWPRIYDRVIALGMASAWPYWEPRPTFLLENREWLDWMHITGVKTA